MPCPTCTHTMQNVGAEGRRVFWCPRCGTLVTEVGARTETAAPRIVDYVRDGEAANVINGSQSFAWSDKVFLYIPRWYWRAIIESVGLKLE